MNWTLWLLLAAGLAASAITASRWAKQDARRLRESCERVGIKCRLDRGYERDGLVLGLFSLPAYIAARNTVQWELANPNAAEPWDPADEPDEPEEEDWSVSFDDAR